MRPNYGSRAVVWSWLSENCPTSWVTPSDAHKPATPGDSAFLFAGDVKMMYPRSYSPLCPSPGPELSNWTCKTTPISVHASLLETSLLFLCLFLRQAPIIKSTWLSGLSTWAFIPLYCVIKRPHRACNGSQLPDPESWCLPTGEGQPLASFYLHKIPCTDTGWAVLTLNARFRVIYIAE